MGLETGLKKCSQGLRLGAEKVGLNSGPKSTRSGAENGAGKGWEFSPGAESDWMLVRENGAETESDWILNPAGSPRVGTKSIPPV